ncbi:MAG: ABC transporter permease [Planctomycetota bacterium]
MIPLRELLKLAFASMGANRFRTTLSMLGVIIGVASVVAIGSVGASGKRIILSELETFGVRTIWVFREWDDQPTKSERGGNWIVNEDLPEILARCPHVARVSPLYDKWNLWASQGSRHKRVRISGVDASYFFIDNESMERGRFLLPADVRLKRKVCVIGSEVWKELYGRMTDPVGKLLDFGYGKFEVIGVLGDKNREFLKSIGSMGGENANDRVVIPYTVYQSKFNQRGIRAIQAEAVRMEDAPAAAEEIKAVLSRRHEGKYKYRSETMKQYIETTESVVGVAWWVALVAAIISLVVGGIGIMNIMTSAVVERIREIGVRKALGAKDRDILVQFLVEAATIATTGGLLGVAFGSGATVAIGAVSRRPVDLSFHFLALGVAVSFATGVFSGLYPAYRAARLDPVEALRYD